MATRIIACILCLAAICRVETLQAQTGTITEEQFLSGLIETHPIFDRERMTADISRRNSESLRGAEDWQVLSSLSFAHQEPTFAFAGPKRTNAIVVEGGLDRTFWKTGGRFSARYTSTWASLKIDPIFGIPDSYYEHRIELSYVHPLLKNKRGLLDRLPFELKQYDIKYEEIQAYENLEQFLARAALDFQIWAFLAEQRNIVTERLRLSKEELERTTKKRQANLIDQADVIRAEDAVRIWEQNKVLVESQWHAVQAQLAVLTQDSSLYHLTPAFDLYALVTRGSLEESIARIEDSSRLVNLLRVRLNQIDKSRQGFVDITRPELSFVSIVNAKRANESLGTSLRLNKPDATIGIQFSYPLGNRSARANVKRNDIEAAQLKKAIDNVILSLVSDYTSLHIQIAELEEVLALNQKQIQSAKQRTAEELKLYDQGRGELTFVILSRDNEQNARLTYANNALTYHQLNLQASALLDNLYRR